MHNETSSIAVDLSFGDSWFTDRNFKSQSFAIDELDDVWEDQESSEFFELSIFEPNSNDKSFSIDTTISTADLHITASNLVEDILNILKVNTDATRGFESSAEFNNKRYVLESALKDALAKYSQEKTIDRMDDHFLDRRKLHKGDIRTESDLDEEIQLLEEEIARLKAQKRLIQAQSPRKFEENSENNGYNSPSSSPLTPASSPSPSPSISLTAISPDDRTRTLNSEINSQIIEKESPQHSKSQSRKRSLSSTYATISVGEVEEKDKPSRRKRTKTKLTCDFHETPSVKGKKKNVGKKQLFQTEQVLKIVNTAEAGTNDEDVDILN